MAPPTIALATSTALNATTATVDLNSAKFSSIEQIQGRTAQEVSRFEYSTQNVDSVRADGVVVRNGTSFNKGPGDGANGGYFSGQDGNKFHTTGTTEDGRVIARHSVDKDGNIVMRPKDGGPNVFSSEVMDVISQLGLQKISDEGITYSRRGFSGKYKLQIEQDGTFSVHYAGGANAAGERCFAQTFHHGYWDESRKNQLSNNDQEQRWGRWQARENADHTAVETAYSEPIAKAGSGFHSATSSNVTDTDSGKITKTKEPLLSTELQERVKTITSDKSTWSGVYTSTESTPATYSLACQHNGQSGILNIKHSTLEQSEVPDVVRSTFRLAINHSNETTADDKLFRSLLLDTPMLSEDGKTVVALTADGSVKDLTNGNLYSIQVKEGEPISWVKTPLTTGTEQELAAPAPSKAPDLSETTPSPTNETEASRPGEQVVKPEETKAPQADKSPQVFAEATTIAEKMNKAMNSVGSNDDEETFTQQIELASEKKLLSQVNDELHRLSGMSIRGLIDYENNSWSSWLCSIGSEHMERINKALGDFNEQPTSTYEKPKPTESSHSSHYYYPGMR